ncbi:ADP-ribosylation factor-like protein 5B, partial [Tieghemiomyces parasiticus]
MGLLASRIRCLFGAQDYRLVIIGLDNAGKTTILYKLISDADVATAPTIGCNVE